MRSSDESPGLADAAAGGVGLGVTPFGGLCARQKLDVLLNIKVSATHNDRSRCGRKGVFRRVTEGRTLQPTSRVVNPAPFPCVPDSSPLIDALEAISAERRSRHALESRLQALTCTGEIGPLPSPLALIGLGGLG